MSVIACCHYTHCTLSVAATFRVMRRLVILTGDNGRRSLVKLRFTLLFRHSCELHLLTATVTFHEELFPLPGPGLVGSLRLTVGRIFRDAYIKLRWGSICVA